MNLKGVAITVWSGFLETDGMLKLDDSKKVRKKGFLKYRHEHSVGRSQNHKGQSSPVLMGYEHWGTDTSPWPEERSEGGTRISNPGEQRAAWEKPLLRAAAFG